MAALCEETKYDVHIGGRLEGQTAVCVRPEGHHPDYHETWLDGAHGLPIKYQWPAAATAEVVADVR